MNRGTTAINAFVVVWLIGVSPCACVETIQRDPPPEWDSGLDAAADGAPGGGGSGAGSGGTGVGATGGTGVGATGGTGVTGGSAGVGATGGAAGFAGGTGGTVGTGATGGTGGTGGTAGTGATGGSAGTGGTAGSAGTGGTAGSAGMAGSAGVGGGGGSSPQCTASNFPNPVCDACMQANCMAECEVCAANVDCVVLMECINGCFDPVCQQNCAAQYPFGVNDALAWIGASGCGGMMCSAECGG